ncbi:RagB/SusD family nutrient uptake outer membrane protein [Ravibacter arvi]|uniref:RagB/SusD family nutrient uptake outer membrane protein n=1 Tax=Ravibacter arvi TaxID=2051041 RepID=A0ABP8LZY9_9BACT
MKRNFFRYIGLLSFLLGFNSCSKLDEEVFTFVSPASFYKGAEDLNVALLGVYGLYRTHFGVDINEWPDGHIRIMELLTEFGAPTNASYSPATVNSWIDINNPSSPSIVNRYSRAYRIINASNVVLGRGEGVVMDQALKEQYFGEARFLRALSYFHLVRLYGGVPIPETFTQGLEGLQIPRKSADETYDYIIADLEYAAAHLPVKSAYKKTDVWRATKGAALAFLGKVYLHRGSIQEKKEYFEKSRDYSRQVITSAEYKLEPDFKDLWYWYNTGNKNGQESVFELQFSHDAYSTNFLHQFTTSFGLGANAVTGAYSYNNMTAPSITAFNSYEPGDLRKSATFVTELTLPNGTKTEWKAADKGRRPGTGGWTASYPGMIKFGDRTQNSVVYELPAANIYAMRYADVLLNFAEADSEAGEGPSDEALAALNQVRDRAGLKPLGKLGKEAFAAAVYRERGWEFIGEGVMFYEGVRTGRIGDGIENEVRYGKENGWYMYTMDLYFKPGKNFLFKIPQGDMNANPLLVQNPDN